MKKLPVPSQPVPPAPVKSVPTPAGCLVGEVRVNGVCRFLECQPGLTCAAAPVIQSCPELAVGFWFSMLLSLVVCR